MLVHHYEEDRNHWRSRLYRESLGSIACKPGIMQADLCDEENWGALVKGADALVHLSCRTDLRAAEPNPAV